VLPKSFPQRPFPLTGPLGAVDEVAGGGAVEEVAGVEAALELGVEPPVPVLSHLPKPTWHPVPQ